MRRSLKKLMARGAEGALSVMLVMVFFLGLMALLIFTLPQGVSLRSLMMLEAERLQDAARDRGLSIDTGEEAPVVRSLIANLTHLDRVVKDKPADALLWSDSRIGVSLEEQHAVQTLSRSGATISFDDESRLRLGENSMIVLRQMQEEVTRRKRVVSLAILEGELDASLGSRRRGQVVLQAEAPGGRVSIQTGGRQSERADLHVAVTSPESSVFSVLSGSAEVTSGGTTVTLGANEAVRVSESGGAGPVVRLAAAPLLPAQELQATHTYRDLPPRVRMAWSDPEATGAYRVTLAADENFSRILGHIDVQRPELVHGNLSAGDLFWRVQSVRDGLPGAPSRVGRVRLVRDVDPPSLEIVWPEARITSKELILRGFAEPGASIYIAHSRIEPAGTGAFEHTLALDPGPNVVVVEAFDAAGNMTHESRILNARY